ncbi:MAG: hypothetical protein M1831_006834 [Alyxoria varia]|nr:MAG: hypothetical protein M1831_006834 [Alyxoria varia]
MAALLDLLKRYGARIFSTAILDPPQHPLQNLPLWPPKTLPQLIHFYDHLTTHIVPGPRSLSYFIPMLLLPIALLIPPPSGHLHDRKNFTLSTKKLRLFFLPLVWACTLRAWLAMRGLDVISLDVALWFTYLLGTKDARLDFSRSVTVFSRSSSTDAAGGVKMDSQHSSSHCTPSSADCDDGEIQSTRRFRSYPSAGSLSDRLAWVFTLLVSIRLNGWCVDSRSHDVRQIHAPPSPTRTRYTLDLLPMLLLNIFVFFPILTVLVHRDPAITSVSSLDLPQSTLESSLASRIKPKNITNLTPMTLTLYTYVTLTTAFNLELPFICLTNYLFKIPPDEWSPQNLAPYFGSFKEGVLDVGLRGLWGKWWHQYMRFTCGGVAEGIVNLVASGSRSEQPLEKDQSITNVKLNTFGGAEPSASHVSYNRTRTKDAATILIAFTLSGLTHTGMVPPAHDQAMEFRMRILSFFLLQGVGIIVEELAWSIARKRPKHSQGSGEIQTKNKSVKEASVSAKAVKRVAHLSFVLFWLWLVSVPLLVPVFDGLGWWVVGIPTAWWV